MVVKGRSHDKNYRMKGKDLTLIILGIWRSSDTKKFKPDVNMVSKVI